MQKQDNKWDELSDLYSTQFYTTEYILLPAVLKTLRNVKNKKILDLGCGTGYFSEILHKKGAEVVGIDSSPKMINIAKLRNKKIKYLVGNAGDLSNIYGQKFDYVLMVMVFCCINNRKAFEDIFSDIKRVLKKNGELIIVDYNKEGFVNFDSYLLKQDLPKYSDSKTPKEFNVRLRNKKGNLLSFSDFYWDLEDYKAILEKINFIIKEIRELRPKEKLIIQGKDVLKVFKNKSIYMLLRIKSNKII